MQRPDERALLAAVREQLTGEAGPIDSRVSIKGARQRERVVGLPPRGERAETEQDKRSHGLSARQWSIALKHANAVLLEEGGNS